MAPNPRSIRSEGSVRGRFRFAHADPEQALATPRSGPEASVGPFRHPENSSLRYVGVLVQRVVQAGRLVVVVSRPTGLFSGIVQRHDKSLFDEVAHAGILR